MAAPSISPCTQPLDLPPRDPDVVVALNSCPNLPLTQGGGRCSGVWIRRTRGRRPWSRGQSAALVATTPQAMGQFPVCEFDEYATIRGK